MYRPNDVLERGGRISERCNETKSNWEVWYLTLSAIPRHAISNARKMRQLT